MLRGPRGSNVFVGHALLAFALAVLFAEWRGWSTRQALLLGAATGAFAALPDVDVVYAVVALDGGQLFGSGVNPTAFWDAANSVHRSMTHSVLVALVAGPAFGLWAVRARTADGATSRRRAWGARVASAVLLVALVAVSIVASGALGAVIMGAFVVAGGAITALSRRKTDLSPQVLGLAATAGLLTHPWGDLVTGQPPQFLYPFGVGVIESRVVLHPDPTMHLLGAFAIELAAVWLAALAIVRVTDRSLGTFYDRSAVLGAGYGALALVLAPPTLAVSYHFVFSILAVGVVCSGLSWYRSTPVAPLRRRPTAGDVRAGFAFGATGLSGTTMALIGYVVVYVSLWL
nr:metal-dependent hydrolase [Halobellus inordinatus]